MRGQYAFFCWKRLFRLPDLKAWYKSFQTTQNWSLNEIELKKEFTPLSQSKKPYCNHFFSSFALKKLTFMFILGVFMFPEVTQLTEEILNEVNNTHIGDYSSTNKNSMQHSAKKTVSLSSKSYCIHDIPHLCRQLVCSAPLGSRISTILLFCTARLSQKQERKTLPPVRLQDSLTFSLANIQKARGMYP